MVEIGRLAATIIALAFVEREETRYTFHAPGHKRKKSPADPGKKAKRKAQKAARRKNRKG